MRLALLARAWTTFFFKRERPTAIALYRIFFGLLVAAKLLLLWPERAVWYGERGVFPLSEYLRLPHPAQLNLLVWWPQTERAIDAYFLIFLFFAAMLTAGLFTRASSIAVYVMLVSLDHRNTFILNSGDTMLRVSSFFLLFAPAGGALSVDRLRRIWSGREGIAIPRRGPWAQRLIQIQISIAYFATFYTKAQGSMWLNGTALYYVLRLQEFHRFPLPFLGNLLLTRLLTWSVLAIEFSAGVLIWFRPLRYFVLAAAVLLHLGIDYSMNIPLFEWTMIAALVTFIPAWDLRRAAAWIQARLTALLGPPSEIHFDGSSTRQRRCAALLQTADILGRFRFADAGVVGGWTLRTRGGEELSGLAALRRIAWRVPLLWPVACLLQLPGSARAARRLGLVGLDPTSRKG